MDKTDPPSPILAPAEVPPTAVAATRSSTSTTAASNNPISRSTINCYKQQSTKEATAVTATTTISLFSAPSIDTSSNSSASHVSCITTGSTVPPIQPLPATLPASTLAFVEEGSSCPVDIAPTTSGINSAFEQEGNYASQQVLYEASSSTDSSDPFISLCSSSWPASSSSLLTISSLQQLLLISPPTRSSTSGNIGGRSSKEDKKLNPGYPFIDDISTAKLLRTDSNYTENDVPVAALPQNVHLSSATSTTLIAFGLHPVTQKGQEAKGDIVDDEGHEVIWQQQQQQKEDYQFLTVIPQHRSFDRDGFVTMSDPAATIRIESAAGILQSEGWKDLNTTNGGDDCIEDKPAEEPINQQDQHDIDDGALNHHTSINQRREQEVDGALNQEDIAINQHQDQPEVDDALNQHVVQTSITLDGMNSKVNESETTCQITAPPPPPPPPPSPRRRSSPRNSPRNKLASGLKSPQTAASSVSVHGMAVAAIAAARSLASSHASSALLGTDQGEEKKQDDETTTMIQSKSGNKVISQEEQLLVLHLPESMSSSSSMTADHDLIQPLPADQQQQKQMQDVLNAVLHVEQRSYHNDAVRVTETVRVTTEDQYGQTHDNRHHYDSDAVVDADADGDGDDQLNPPIVLTINDKSLLQHCKQIQKQIGRGTTESSVVGGLNSNITANTGVVVQLNRPPWPSEDGDYCDDDEPIVLPLIHSLSSFPLSPLGQGEDRYQSHYPDRRQSMPASSHLLMSNIAMKAISTTPPSGQPQQHQPWHTQQELQASRVTKQADNHRRYSLPVTSTNQTDTLSIATARTIMSTLYASPLPHSSPGGTSNSHNPNISTNGSVQKKKKLAELIRRDVWDRDPDVVLQALIHMSEAAKASAAHREIIARTGGILAIVRAMEQHSTNPNIQIAACRALEALALDSDNEVAIGEVGGIDAVLSAMMQHFTNPLVQESAWSCLWNLTCLNATEPMTVDTAGGMEAIVSCMRQHLDQPIVQQYACGALANLCMHNDERLKALAEADGFVALSSALQRHWHDDKVRYEASRALCVLLERNVRKAEQLG